GLELALQHRRVLDAEADAAGVLRQQQRTVGRQLLQAVAPVGQAADAVIDHRAQQLAALLAAPEALHRLGVVKQERQVEQLQLGGVAVELGQRRRQQLHSAVQQGLHLVGVAVQGGAGIHLDPDLARQALFGQLLEQQGPLALGGVVGDHMGEADEDRLLGQDRQGQKSGEQETQEATHGVRSEEHTSELQSRENLVCRLLLEK